MSASGTNENKVNRNENNDAKPAWRDARGVWHPYEGSLKDVRIPRGARVVGPPDVGPGTGPFTGRKTIRTVFLPEGVTTISFRAFRNCSSLSRVDLPRSLEKIGGWAFEGTSPREFRYPGTVEEFERIAIDGRESLGEGKPAIRCADATIDFAREPFWVDELSFAGTKAEWKSKYPPKEDGTPHWLYRRVAVVHCSDGDVRAVPKPVDPVQLATKGDWTFFEGTEYIPYDFERNIPSARTLAIPASVTAIAGFLDAAEAPMPAHAFDPLDRDDPDITMPAEEREIGGLGIYMVKKSMDDVRYRRLDNVNELTIVKRF